MTSLYLAEAGNLGDDWYVCEPFGFDPSAKFRADLELRMRESLGLLGTLQRLLARSVHSNVEQYRAWKDRLREDAELKVDLSLTIAARKLMAYPHLVELEIGLEEAATEASPYVLRRIGGACRAALEALFRELASQYPLRGLANALYTGYTPNRDRQFVQECYRTAAKSTGILGEIPRSLLNVKPEQIKAVCDYDDAWRLRPSIVATVLLAARQPIHPLRAAVQQIPDFLQRLDAVAEMSGDAVHSQDFTSTLDDVRLIVRTVYQAISILMNLPFEEMKA
jgi:hypothetical protein